MGEGLRKMDDNKSDLVTKICTGHLGFGLIGLAYLNARSRDDPIIKQGYVIPDLNKDGKDDMFLEQENGHKLPLYAHVKNDGSIEYLSGKEMKKIDPTTDYNTIEDILNKKE